MENETKCAKYGKKDQVKLYIKMESQYMEHCPRYGDTREEGTAFVGRWERGIGG